MFYIFLRCIHTKKNNSSVPPHYKCQPLFNTSKRTGFGVIQRNIKYYFIFSKNIVINICWRGICRNYLCKDHIVKINCIISSNRNCSLITIYQSIFREVWFLNCKITFLISKKTIFFFQNF